MGSKDLGNFKTLVVCSSGIGTSKMLATRLQKEFPELRFIQNVSVMEFQKMDKTDYQLVISTIPIPDYNGDYIVVNPFLNKDEIEKIRSFINEYKFVNSSETQLPVTFHPNKSQKSTSKLIEEMKTIKEYTGTIATILEGFDLTELGNETVKELLTVTCQKEFQLQRIIDVEKVVDAILEREGLGGNGIPETAMALFHARSPYVIQPIFTITTLNKPIRVFGMDGVEMNMECLILLLSPANASEQMLEVLSFLSSLLIESEENSNVFQSIIKEKIAGLLTDRLGQFFNHKLTELRSV
ncbi:PTS sugar transporter subunit IIA [Bacillus sp. ISL-18]|uniref:PTS sugar transporter subunit IIA n=1 Tax=Bacillus sp. ISL-18 TaxID=2819118 RepID=UPI002035B7D8|nr:PTS sugar transporter subunit IIA [Bacillus sp. ISL-18]